MINDFIKRQRNKIGSQAFNTHHLQTKCYEFVDDHSFLVRFLSRCRYAFQIFVNIRYAHVPSIAIDNLVFVCSFPDIIHFSNVVNDFVSSIVFRIVVVVVFRKHNIRLVNIFI